MARQPQAGDLYLIKQPIQANTKVKYRVGGTVLLVARIEGPLNRDAWRAVDEFGIGIWDYVSFRINEGELELLKGKQ